MSEYLADTGDVSRGYCPGCSPERDPTTEILRVVWCSQHAPGDKGDADGIVTAPEMYSGSAGQAEGHECRAFAEWQRSLR